MFLSNFRIYMNTSSLDSAVGRSRQIALFALVGAVVLHGIWFFFVHGRVLSSDPADWGAFGDFVGGILNPVIAYMAFYWLTVSVSVQKAELSETRDALLESRDAQRAQAKSTEKAMRMQAVGIQLQAVDTQLRSLYEFRGFVLERGSGSHENYVMLTPTGEKKTPNEIIFALAENISLLEMKRHVLVDVSEKIVNEC
jgi:hypothetical protein